MITFSLVPDAPNVKVIPQYSLNDGGQPLTRIIVLIDQNVSRGIRKFCNTHE